MPPRLLVLAALTSIIAPLSFAAEFPRSGPDARFKISDAIVLSDFTSDLPPAEPSRELKLSLPEAITLTATEKRGIPGGGGVREVPVTVYGTISVVLPFTDKGFDYAASKAEVLYTGAQTIRASAPLQAHPDQPLTRKGNAITGRVRFPVQFPARGKDPAPALILLDIQLDLAISNETFGYTPDPDAAIPPWRSDKSKPSGQKITGRWRTYEQRNDSVVETDGAVTPTSALRAQAAPGFFAPIGAASLARAKGGGLEMTAFASPERVDQGDSQWAVKLLDQPVDLRKFNGVRLTVRSDKPFAGKDWKGPAPVGAAVAIRERGGQWFTCRTVTPLLGGTQTWVADLGLFARGAPSPGLGGGPNTRYFLDPSKIDAIAVGVNNPFGVGTVRFDALKLEAVRWEARGNGEPPGEPVTVRVDSSRFEALNDVASVPKALFGFHVAGKIAKPASLEGTPPSFQDPPVSGDPIEYLRLLKPGSLRPLEHTGMAAGAGGGIRGMDPAIAAAADATDAVMFTVTNHNLWARPSWMDQIKNDTPANLDSTRAAYEEGIRKMFAQIGSNAWDPKERPDSNLRLIEYWNEPFMWARHINRGNSTLSAGPGDPGGNRGKQAWNDPTQFTYIPAKLGGEMYGRFFNAAHDGLAETNPNVKIGGISGPAFLEEFGEHFRRYWMPFLEVSKDRVDFLTEHHYQGDPESYAASYETVTAHTLAKFGKSWPIWNTEANDLQDIAPGDERTADAARAYTQMNRAYYNYRDILELIRFSRDKAAGRAIHAFWSPGLLRDDGEFQMYRLTADLRGNVVSTESDAAAIVPIASSGAAGVAVYLLNDSPHPREVTLAVSTAVERASDYACLALSLDETQGRTTTEPVTLTVARDADGQGVKVRFARPMRPREIRKILFPQTSYPVIHDTKQHYANVSLAEVRPGAAEAGTVAWRSRVTGDRIESARLRVVTRDVQEGEATVELAGGAITLPLPSSRSSADGSVIQLIPLTSPQLDELRKHLGGSDIPFTVRCDAAYDGFGLSMASLDVTMKP